MKCVYFCGIILLLFFSFSNCTSLGYQIPEYEKIADQITNKTAAELKEEKNLILIGTGGGMMDDIKMMAMSFDYYHEVNLEQARELIVYSMNKYLSDINKNKKIRPYLHEYPFSSKNIEIRIFIYGPDRRDLPPEKIYCINSRNGIIRYYTYLDRDHPLCKETYEEALKEVEENAAKADLSQAEKFDGKSIIHKIVAKDGAKVTVVVDSFEYSMFQAIGEGFKPEELLNCISTSCNEVLPFQIQADPEGKLPCLKLMPAVIGKEGGICHIDILGDRDPIQFKLPWGTELQKSHIDGN